MDQSAGRRDATYFVVDSPYEIANWRPLVNWVLYIPHAIVLYALQILSRVVFLIYWLMLIVTGKLHPGLYGVMVMYERYNTRATAFLFGYSELYAPFDFSTSVDDNGAYPPARLTLPPVTEDVKRSAALNVFAAIPHYFVLAVYAIAGVVVAVIGWFAVLFTGRWPKDMRDFLVRLANYYYRIWAYVAMVEKGYPSFSLPQSAG